MLLYLRARVPIPFDVFICQTSTRCSLHSKCEKDLSIGGEKKENTRTLRERKKMEMEALTRGNNSKDGGCVNDCVIVFVDVIVENER